MGSVNVDGMESVSGPNPSHASWTILLLLLLPSSPLDEAAAAAATGVFRSLNTFIPSNAPPVKNAMVSSNCDLSIALMVMDCSIALVSLNSGRDPTAALALLGNSNDEAMVEAVAMAVAVIVERTFRRRYCCWLVMLLLLLEDFVA